MVAEVIQQLGSLVGEPVKIRGKAATLDELVPSLAPVRTGI
jgi:hypothetical protein